MSSKTFSKHSALLSSAIIASHSQAKGKLFRQKDVLFYLELFMDWFEVLDKPDLKQVQHTQIARLLDKLSQEGFCKKNTKEKRPLFSLSRVGLLELLGRIALSAENASEAEFLFAYYFLSNYGSRLRKLVEEEGSSFPLSLKMEVEILLDSRALLTSRINSLEKQIKRLKTRIEANRAGASFTTQALKKNTPWQELLPELDKRFPYSHSSQKPLDELFQTSPKEIVRWELETGPLKRSAELWQPMLESLKGQLSRLSAIQASRKD